VLIAGHHRGEGDGWRCLVEPLAGVTGREIRTPQSLGSADIIIVRPAGQSGVYFLHVAGTVRNSRNY
jgi:hypothetical protein